jgi:mono/diheme cytochrome c family protein
MRGLELIGCLLVLLVVAACNPKTESAIDYEDLPAAGDAARGAELFTQAINSAPPCSGCHMPGASASPELMGFGAVAGTRVEGQDAREYTFYAIVEPARFIVDGYGNAMYNQYSEKLSEQDIADLIAYLLEQ